MKRATWVLALLLALCVACSKEKGADKQNLEGLTSLHRAAEANDLKAVEKLLREGTPPDIPDAEGVTALHRAARDNQVEMTELLLRYHANPDARTDRGWTALQLAAMKGRMETLELLIRFGANPTLQTPEGENPLHLAVTCRDPALVGEVLRDAAAWAERKGVAAADIKRTLIQQADQSGETPFQLAVTKGAWDVVGALLVEGADPNTPTKDGRLALNEAVRAGDFNAITLLITYGANPGVRGADGQSSYDIAGRMNRPDIVEFLNRLAPQAQ